MQDYSSTEIDAVDTFTEELAELLGKNGLDVEDKFVRIRDIASFIVTGPSGQQFTVAVSPVRSTCECNDGHPGHSTSCQSPSLHG
jgi:hypothetical protein